MQMTIQSAGPVPALPDGGQLQRPVRRVNAQRAEVDPNVMITLPARQIHVTPRMAASILLRPAGVLLTMCVIRTILSILIINARHANQKPSRMHGLTYQPPAMTVMHAQRTDVIPCVAAIIRMMTILHVAINGVSKVNVLVRGLTMPD